MAVPSSCNRLAVWALLLIGSLALDPGGTTAVDPIRLRPFTSRVLGLRGVVPQGWTRLRPGCFARATTPTDQAVLQLVLYRGTSLESRVSSLASGMNADTFAEVGPRTSVHFAWTLYRAEVQVPDIGAVAWAFAVAERDSVLYFVALKGAASEYGRLYESVFLPVLDSLRVPPDDPHGSAEYFRANRAAFDYDRTAPLDVRETGRERRDSVTVLDITYASPKGGRVPAFLVVPQGPGPFAGVILLHGSGSSRRSLLGRGVAYARAGAVAILIDAPHARPENREGRELTFTEKDYADQVQLIVDLRRAVDLLSSRSDVDADRLAYVGFSFGAALGGLLAGVEDRLRAYALMSGDGGWVSHLSGFNVFYEGIPRSFDVVWDRWIDGMWSIEPLHFVGHAAPAALLFQAGRQDRSVREWQALPFQRAGSEPKQVLWYESGHDLPDQAWLDQAAWLQRYTGIDATRFRLGESGSR